MRCVICDVCGKRVTYNEYVRRVKILLSSNGMVSGKLDTEANVTDGHIFDLCDTCAKNLDAALMQITNKQREEELHANR